MAKGKNQKQKMQAMAAESKNAVDAKSTKLTQNEAKFNEPNDPGI